MARSGRPFGYLALLFAVSLFLTLFIAAGGSAAAGRLFQSPQSPPAAPEAPADGQEAEPAPAPADETAPPADQPAMEAPVDAQEEAPAPADETVPPVDQPAMEAPLPESAPAAEPERPVRRDAPTLDSAEERQGSRNFILDRAELVDSVIVSGAYVWVCCGIGLLLLAPIFLLVLEIRGRHKVRKEEEQL